MRVVDPSSAGAYWHIVLSPHLDDAALSIGGTISRLTRGGERVLVVTLCAGIPEPLAEVGPFARRLLGGRTPAGWVMLRRAEDTTALAHLDADLWWEGALDAIFRRPDVYGASRRALFGRPIPGDSIGARAIAVAAMFEHFGRRSMIYAPLGVGGHVDHRALFDAARLAVWRHGVGFYEDFPYCARRGAVARRLDELSRAGISLRPIEIEVRETLEHRVAAALSYTSQVPLLFGSRAGAERAIRRAAGRRCVERLWVAP